MRLRRPDPARKVEELRRRDALPRSASTWFAYKACSSSRKAASGNGRERSMSDVSTPNNGDSGVNAIIASRSWFSNPAGRACAMRRHDRRKAQRLPLMIADADPLGDTGLENAAR